MAKQIQNNHQILYAKNFYRHSGNLINDMKVICKLDCPSQDFYSPKFILNFMRKQFNAWLDATPEVKKERESKVAWDDDPIRAEIWSILIAYKVYVPMTCIGGYIKELPNYNVMPPHPLRLHRQQSDRKRVYFQWQLCANDRHPRQYCGPSCQSILDARPDLHANKRGLKSKPRN